MWFSSIWIFSSKVIQKWDCYWVLAQVFTAPMLSKSEILMSMNSKQKLLCQLATAELFPNDTGKQQKCDKKAFGLDALDYKILSLCNHTKPYFLAWWSLTAQAEGPFQDSKELKMNWRVAVFQDRLSTLSIRYIQSDKLRQTNCNEFLDDFVMKAGQNLPNSLLRYVQPHLIRWLSLLISCFNNNSTSAT